MKKLLISTVFLFILALTSIAQESHLSRIYDFNGKDFDFSVKGMVGMNDSLYVLIISYIINKNKSYFFKNILA